MKSLKKLYELFDLNMNCTDDDLRQAYRLALLTHHPDLNPNSDSTVRTQELIRAYKKLKDFREVGKIRGDAVESEMEDFSFTNSDNGEIIFTVEFSGVNIEAIAKRKAKFREAWHAFSQNPSDPILAINLIHAAFRAERGDIVSSLITNPLLIDSAVILIHSDHITSVIDTLIKWSDILYQVQLENDSLKLLEDAYSEITAKLPESTNEMTVYEPSSAFAVKKLVEKLLKLHYYFAQGRTSNGKLEPEARIRHLKRELDLGHDSPYFTGHTYKLLAEAFYEKGNDTKARYYLNEALKYESDIQTLGAVRIARALGFLPQKTKKPKTRRKPVVYKFTELDAIPKPYEIRQLAERGLWKDILSFADLTTYSPRIISSCRNTLRQIAISFGSCNSAEVRKALLALLDSVYWDVRKESIIALSKVGDMHCLQVLQDYSPKNTSDRITVPVAISYLNARLKDTPLSTMPFSLAEFKKEAERAIESRNYVHARLLLEHIVALINEDHQQYIQIMVLLAKACGEMGDTAQALDLIKPIYTKANRKLSLNKKKQLTKDLASWFMYQLIAQDYHPSLDQDYLLAINLHLNQALVSKDADEILKNLRDLTRWLEIFGEGQMAQWIRKLIRDEAPGTVYVDSHDRINYIRSVDLSQNFKAQLDTIYDLIKNQVPEKLKKVLKSPHSIKSSTHLLDEV